MDTQTIQIVAGYVALAVPITVAITNLSKLALEWLNQKHLVKTARIQQTHEITTHYLNRALDPSVPLAIRHQLLRFLATPDKDGSRLNDWAKSELNRVQSVVDETDKAVSEAEKELMAAKTSGEVVAAEKKLSFATSKKQSLLEPPKPPPITPATLRAGLIAEKKMTGLVMKDSDLRGMELHYRDLNGADFSGSVISGGNLQGSELRGANFEKADLTNVSFYESDLRAANLQGANLKGFRAPKARLEGTDFTGAVFAEPDLTRATFDDKTKWPQGFDPEKHGAVKIII
jgi:uncharacterized protein YjbI with pentapeptide repeats